MGAKKHFRFCFVTLFFFLSVVCCALGANAASTVTASVKGQFHYQKAYEVAEYTNQIREKAGKDALTIDNDLMSAAMQRAAEIPFIFDHTRPDQSMFFTISDKAWGENIAAGQSSAADAGRAWYDSKEHYRNIIDDDYQTLGVGCFQLKDTLYWVQIFGKSDAKNTAKPTGASLTRSTDIAFNSGYFEKFAFLTTNNKKTGGSATLRKGSRDKLQLSFQSTLSDRESFTSDGSFPTLLWKHFTLKSSNPAVLTVDSAGNLNARKKGTATVAAYYNADPNVRFSCKFTVKDADERSVVLNANGGSMQKDRLLRTKKISVLYKKNYGAMPAPYRKNYLFKGWYTAKSGGSKVRSSTVVKIASGKKQTLYARWRKCRVRTAVISGVSSPSKAQLTAVWQKHTYAKGYEVAVASRKEFGTYTEKKILLDSNRKTSYTFRNLLFPGKRYYVRVRAYKIDSAGKRIFGKCRTVRSVIVKE